MERLSGDTARWAGIAAGTRPFSPHTPSYSSAQPVQHIGSVVGRLMILRCIASAKPADQRFSESRRRHKNVESDVWIIRYAACLPHAVIHCIFSIVQVASTGLTTVLIINTLYSIVR